MKILQHIEFYFTLKSRHLIIGLQSFCEKAKNLLERRYRTTYQRFINIYLQTYTRALNSSDIQRYFQRKYKKYKVSSSETKNHAIYSFCGKRISKKREFLASSAFKGVLHRSYRCYGNLTSQTDGYDMLDKKQKSI